MTIKIKFLLILLLFAMLTAVVFLVVHLKNKKSYPEKVNINLSTFQTSIGWGYKIDVNNKPFVYQAFIPVIETHSGFESKEVAEKTGKIVVNKIISHQQPTLTLQDLQLAGVNIDSLLLNSTLTDLNK